MKLEKTRDFQILKSISMKTENVKRESELLAHFDIHSELCHSFHLLR